MGNMTDHVKEAINQVEVNLYTGYFADAKKAYKNLPEYVEKVKELRRVLASIYNRTDFLWPQNTLEQLLTMDRLNPLVCNFSKTEEYIENEFGRRLVYPGDDY